jgi:hypothetical protein
MFYVSTKLNVISYTTFAVILRSLLLRECTYKPVTHSCHTLSPTNGIRLTSGFCPEPQPGTALTATRLHITVGRRELRCSRFLANHEHCHCTVRRGWAATSPTVLFGVKPNCICAGAETFADGTHLGALDQRKRHRIICKSEWKRCCVRA